MSKKNEPPNDVILSRALDKEVERAINMDAAMQGFEIKFLPVGAAFAIKTRNRTYVLEHRTDGWYISGHPKICPKPTIVQINGSTWGGTSIRAGYVGIGLHLEYRLLNPADPERDTATTTPIVEIRPIANASEGTVN